MPRLPPNGFTAKVHHMDYEWAFVRDQLEINAGIVDLAGVKRDNCAAVVQGSSVIAADADRNCS